MIDWDSENTLEECIRKMMDDWIKSWNEKLRGDQPSEGQRRNNVYGGEVKQITDKRQGFSFEEGQRFGGELKSTIEEEWQMFRSLRVEWCRWWMKENGLEEGWQRFGGGVKQMNDERQEYEGGMAKLEEEWWEVVDHSRKSRYLDDKSSRCLMRNSGLKEELQRFEGVVKQTSDEK